jgi:hypothetical protein
MPDQLEIRPEPPPYRFIDDGEDEVLEAGTSKVLTVEFYPSIEDFVHISHTNAKKYTLPSLTKVGLQAFFVLNCVGLPALLIYADLFGAAFAVFAINIALAVFLLPNLVKTDYRRYYRAFFGNLENEVVRVELHATGIACKHLADSSFYAWKNFTYVEETKDSIILYMTGGRGLAVRKSGFAYDDERAEFLTFARERIPAQQLQNAS